MVGKGTLTSFLPLPRAWNLGYLGHLGYLGYLRYLGHLGYLGRLGHLGIPYLVRARTFFPLPRAGIPAYDLQAAPRDHASNPGIRVAAKPFLSPLEL